MLLLRSLELRGMQRVGPIMAKIGVLSDTHIPLNAPRVPDSVLRGLEGVDMILHAGDLVSLSVLDTLRQIADTRAVCGNMDPPEVRSELPATLMVAVADRRIGLIHGSGAPFGLADRAQAEFLRREGATPDVLVFGHSHEPIEDVHGNLLRFNPGSPTDRRFTAYRSYGILTIGETVESAVIPLD